jgi:hypothetical protein
MRYRNQVSGAKEMTEMKKGIFCTPLLQFVFMELGVTMWDKGQCHGDSGKAGFIWTRIVGVGPKVSKVPITLNSPK